MIGRLRQRMSVTLALALALAAAASTTATATATATAAPESKAESAAIERREEWRKSRVHVYMNDFGELGRYRRANAALKPAAPGDNRVVFMGDSITDMWRLETFFPGKPYVNRGISGQTTQQMLVRFRPDVVALRPRAVVILAGTNDIAGNTGPMTLDEIEGNYASMAELARSHGIRVVFSSILPVHNYTPQSETTFPLRPLDKIVELNRWMKAYCAANGHVYLDYFTPMVDDKGFLKRELAEDGLHPGKAGYTAMAALAQAAIDRALAGR
jgi:lysophospholipase L1-like esterase